MVNIKVDAHSLEGNLVIPEGAKGIVLFAHGSGSSRHSPRNQYVAKFLQSKKIATLLIDLLTKEEEREDAFTGHLRFDIRFLTDRLVKITDWLVKNPASKNLQIGLFGASTGAAAALATAAERQEAVKAVVSRGGRPDLAAPILPLVRAPTLLIVGSHDIPVIGMNEDALRQLTCEKKMVLVAGATHLFEEPGTLEEVARIAADWFDEHFQEKGAKVANF